MTYSSRFWLFAPLVLLFALAAWVMGYWWVVADAMDKRLTALNGHEAAPGIVISYDSKTISGFPFNLDLVFKNLTVQGQGAHGPFRWTAENFALHRLTYGPAQDIYEAAGNQSLSWTDGGGESHSIKFLPGLLHASAASDSKGLARFDLEMVAAGGSATDGAPFTAAHAQLHLRRDPKADAVDLQISGDEINSGGRIAPFGNHIKSLSLYVTLTEGRALAPLLAGRESWAKAAADWKAHGGQAVPGPVAVSSTELSLTANNSGDGGAGLADLLDVLY
jgi:hypothetical protein